MLVSLTAHQQGSEAALFGPSEFPLRVLAPDELLLELARHATLGYNKLRHGGIEVGGILYGTIDGDQVRCARFVVLESEHLYGPRFRLSPGDCAQLESLLAAKHADEEIVGWWVAHGRTGLALTDHDRELFDSHFPDPRHIALVLKPTVMESVTACLFARIGSEFGRGSEFTIVADKPDAPAEQPVSEQHPTRLSRPRVTAVEPSARNGKQALLVGVGAVVMILLASGVMGWRGLRAPAPRVEERIIQVMPTPVDLRDADRDRFARLEAEIARLRAQIERPSRAPEKGSASTRAPEKGSASTRAQASEQVPSAPEQAQRPLARIFSLLERPRPAIQPVDLAPPPTSGVDVTPREQVRDKRDPGHSIFLPLAEPPGSGVSAGRVIWTGVLKNGFVLSIDGRQPSGGRLHAALPGRPVQVSVLGGELTTDGIVLYTDDASRAGRVEQPGPQNGWNRTVYRFDPKRASQLAVLETPTAQNGWKKLVVRSSGRPLSVLAVDWQGNR